MKPGPRAKSDAESKAQGRTAKKLKTNEPKPLPGRPRCPTWLNRRAQAVWRQVVPMLEELGTLSRSDGGAIARYADAVCRWRDAAKALDESPLVYESKRARDGGSIVRANPAARLYNDFNGIALRLEEQLGLTPASRGRLTIPDATGEGDALDRLLKVARG